MYNAFYHPHAYFWIILVVLFFATYFLMRANKAKGAKITHMILRLFYVIMLGSGIGLLVSLNFASSYILKGILAFSLVYFMESILVKTKKDSFGNKPQVYYWIMCSVTLVLVVLMGYRVISF
jgi:hypothetical protein